ncbi:MAG TPA: hypothetical protein VGI67_16660 [Thermoleophilaceae bacterium]|jgi:hypothetical protein
MGDSDRIERHRQWIAGILFVLGAPQGLIGLWALFAPRNFYKNFGIGSGGWVSTLGAYDEHLVRDVGALFCALAVVMIAAAIRGRRSLAYTAVAAWLTFAVPHMVWHMFHLGPFSLGNAIANVVSLGWTVLGALIVLVLLHDSKRPARARAR